MPDYPKVYILMPTRNRKVLLDKCLESIFAQSYPNYEVVVVDDGSTDGTKELVTQNYKKVSLLHGDGNLWWTGAMREAINYVIPRAGEKDLVLIQNDDTFMKNDYLEKLVNQSLGNGRLVIGTAVKKYPSDELVYNSHQIVKGLIRPVIINSDEDILPTHTLSGRGSLTPIEVFKSVGNFSRLFPQYGADYDFYCRAARKGYRLGMSTSVITYSTDAKLALSKTIKSKSKISIKDITKLFFSRKSSSNLWATTMITLLYVPLPSNLIGVVRIYLYFFKIAVINIIAGTIRRIFRFGSVTS